MLLQDVNAAWVFAVSERARLPAKDDNLSRARYSLEWSKVGLTPAVVGGPRELNITVQPLQGTGGYCTTSVQNCRLDGRSQSVAVIEHAPTFPHGVDRLSAVGTASQSVL